MAIPLELNHGKPLGICRANLDCWPGDHKYPSDTLTIPAVIVPVLVIALYSALHNKNPHRRLSACMPVQPAVGYAISVEHRKARRSLRGFGSILPSYSAESYSHLS